VTGRRIDLDAARKARAETAEPPVVELGGQEFTLPAGLPAIVAVGLARARRGALDGVEEAFEGLFGDRADEAMRLGLELDDLDVILEQAYGETPGE
jgi:hypothetical protein